MSRATSDGAPRTKRCDMWSKRTISASPVLGVRSQSKSPVYFKKVLGERRCHSIPGSKPPPTINDVLERNRITETILSAPDRIPKIPNLSDSEDPVIPYSILTKMQRTLAAKKRELLRLKKNMITAQNVVIESYASIRELQARASCPTEESVGEIRVVSLTGWPAHDLLALIRSDFENFAHIDVGGVFGPQILQQLQSQLYSIPDEVFGLGAELITRATALLNLAHSKHRGDRSNVSPKIKPSSNTSEQTESMQSLVAVSAQNLKAKLSYVMKLAKMPWLDRDILIKKLEKVSKENLILQNKIDEMKKVDEVQKPPPAPEVAYEAVIEELRRESSAREALKEVVAEAESMLRNTRAKYSALDRQLKETKAELELLRRKHKDLEQLYRHRESSYDARSKKLIEVSKTGEITIETLAKQRDAFELRVKELREHAETIQKAADKRDANQRAMIDSLETRLVDQEKFKVEKQTKINELEMKLKEVEEKYEKLYKVSTNFVDTQKNTSLDEYIPTKESEPSNEDIDIWTELQKTRGQLAALEEELKQSRANKDNFLKSISKIAQDGRGNVEDTLAEELVEKEKKIFELEHYIEELKENEKNMERDMIHYENRLAALRIEVHRLRNYDCYIKELPQQELETELTELHIQVETLCRERSALLTAAASRALMLERHERAADLFATITRARRQLAAHLNKQPDLPELPENKVEEVTSSLSSVYATAGETWTALRAERARVLRLESAVVAQGSQLQREGCVRTQLEARRADLERKLIMLCKQQQQQQSTTFRTDNCNQNSDSLDKHF